MKGQVVQWTGDNAAEAERLLVNHLARADKAGDKLNIVGLGLNLTLGLGDSLILDGDRLGVLRANPEKQPETWVTWQGNNLDKCRKFLKSYKVDLEVSGKYLGLFGDESGRAWFTLDLGDRIVNRDGEIIISKAGRDHRLQ